MRDLIISILFRIYGFILYGLLYLFLHSLFDYNIALVGTIIFAVIELHKDVYNLRKEIKNKNKF